MTDPRDLGYCFSRVSRADAYDAAGELAMVMAEVQNTFGKSHPSWMDASIPARTHPEKVARKEAP